MRVTLSQQMRDHLVDCGILGDRSAMLLEFSELRAIINSTYDGGFDGFVIDGWIE